MECFFPNSHSKKREISRSAASYFAKRSAVLALNQFWNLENFWWHFKSCALQKLNRNTAKRIPGSFKVFYYHHPVHKPHGPAGKGFWKEERSVLHTHLWWSARGVEAFCTIIEWAANTAQGKDLFLFWCIPNPIMEKERWEFFSYWELN